MVIDTSAVLAILFQEDDRRRYAEAIESSSIRLISAVTRVELFFVIEGRKHETGREKLEHFLSLMGIEIVTVTSQQALSAIEAFRRYGKGRHPARLNMGDCFSYALATTEQKPLLFKGNDFSQTDIVPAIK